MKRLKKKYLWFAVLSVIIISLIIIVWGNTALELNTYTITSSQLPKNFNGYRIAHISDLHNAQIDKDNIKLLTMLQEAAPDMIAITSDLIDSRNTNVDNSLQFI